MRGINHVSNLVMKIKWRVLEKAHGCRSSLILLQKQEFGSILEDIMRNSSNTSPSEPSEVASSEVERYFTEAPLPLICKNPLTWWEMRTQYIHLSSLAKKMLCIPATSVPSERVFSVAGNIINEKRSRLKPDNVNKLIFLYENMS